MKHNLDSMIGRFRDELLANFRTGYDDDEEVVSFNAFKNESSKKVGLKAQYGSFVLQQNYGHPGMANRRCVSTFLKASTAAGSAKLEEGGAAYGK